MGISKYDLLRYALSSGEYETVSAPIESARRENEKRPASIRFNVPDELVKAIRGTKKEKPEVYLLVVRPEVREALRRRSGSGIVTPDEHVAEVSRARRRARR